MKIFTYSEDIKFIPTASPSPFSTSLDSLLIQSFFNVYLTSSSATLLVLTATNDISLSIYFLT